MRLICSLLLCLCSSLVSAVTLNQVVVFGDSLSDNGNLYEYMKHQLPSSPPYFAGRFSNGRIWVERLLSTYYPDSPATHLLDYAFGGAGVSEDPNSNMLFTLDHEIDSYLLSHQDKADPDSLFMVWIGANNYLELPLNIEQTVGQVNLGIKHSLERLANAGAQHVIVLNLPDLGQSPYAKLTHMETLLTTYTNLHNSALQYTLHELKISKPGVQWLHYDVKGLLDTFLHQPDQYGFTNVEDSCSAGGLSLSLLQPALKPAAQNYAMINFAVPTTSKATRMKTAVGAPHCEDYLFFDPVHPASRAHQLMAEALRNLLDSVGIKIGV